MSGVEQATGQPAAQLGGARKRWECFTDWARAQGEVILRPLIRILANLRVHPNTITLVGFALQGGVGVLFGFGRIQLGGWLLLLVAPVDALDGALARAVGQKSRFGAFLDSTLDRLSDAALLLGLTAHFIGQARYDVVALLLISLVAAQLVSYVRARAEALGFTCKVGLLTRLERILLIGVFCGLGLPVVMAWLLALLSLATAVQRVLYIYALSRGDGGA